MMLTLLLVALDLLYLCSEILIFLLELLVSRTSFFNFLLQLFDISVKFQLFLLGSEILLILYFFDIILSLKDLLLQLVDLFIFAVNNLVELLYLLKITSLRVFVDFSLLLEIFFHLDYLLAQPINLLFSFFEQILHLF